MVFRYTQLDPEAPNIIANHRPAARWPEKGEIVFENVQLRYRPVMFFKNK